MKKYNRHAKTAYAVFAYVVCVWMFAGCKSVPAGPAIDSLSILDNNSSVYFKIPVEPHRDFVKSMLVSQITGISNVDAEQIASQIDILYAGIGTPDTPDRIQLSASGSIPSIAVRTMLTEKKGWTKHTIELAGGPVVVPYSYFTRNGTDLQLALPSHGNILLADDVQPLLKNYDKAISGSAVSDSWVSDTREWMSVQSPDIRFCVVRPQAFLARLLGTEMRLALVCAKGSFVENSNGRDFLLSLDLEFKNIHVVRAAQAMLTLVLGNDIGIERKDESCVLSVSNIHIQKEQVLTLLSNLQ